MVEHNLTNAEMLHKLVQELVQYDEFEFMDTKDKTKQTNDILTEIPPATPPIEMLHKDTQLNNKDDKTPSKKTINKSDDTKIRLTPVILSEFKCYPIMNYPEITARRVLYYEESDRIILPLSILKNLGNNLIKDMTVLKLINKKNNK